MQEGKEYTMDSYSGVMMTMITVVLTQLNKRYKQSKEGGEAVETGSALAFQGLPVVTDRRSVLIESLPVSCKRTFTTQ